MIWHWHKWEAVAVNQRKQPIIEAGILVVEDCVVPYTDILYRCECGKIKAKSIHGYWTLEQIRGK